MPPKNSIFRQPGAQHFQLVHRSRRDPLYHDPEASQHVLKQFERSNTMKGTSRRDLELALGPDDLAHDLGRANLGEASLYGIYYDDTDYDYMQHLREVGTQEDGVDSILLEAPVSRSKGKGREKVPIALRNNDLPPEALPSTSELPHDYEAQEAIPSSIAGFQPEMDPHLRQTLEALEDDAFVDDSLNDNFFDELIGDGEREYMDEVEFEFEEDGIADAVEASPQADADTSQNESESWEERFSQFKKAQKFAAQDDSASDFHSEGEDTVGTLPALSVVGGKRRRKGSSIASGYSMSSSSMFRNEGLTTLDERFDKIEREYMDDEDGEDEEDGTTSDDDEVPELITSREDFDAMMDEFLDHYEVLGRKLLPKLEGTTGTEKLETIRRALAEAGPVDLNANLDEKEPEILMPVDVDNLKDRWDCETVLTTYSNLENHPRIIRARDTKPVPKIKINVRTGLPVVEEERVTPTPRSVHLNSSATEESEEESDRPVRLTITRQRGESKDEKKARKQAAKADKQTRRIEKKANKEVFSNEYKKQQKVMASRETARTRKL